MILCVCEKYGDPSLFLLQGYMEENRISGLKRDADVFCTFEGDNVVLLQVRQANVTYQLVIFFCVPRLFSFFFLSHPPFTCKFPFRHNSDDLTTGVSFVCVFFFQQVTKELLTQLAKKYGNKMYAVILSAKEGLLSRFKTRWKSCFMKSRR